jgi:putative transposase
MPSLLYRFLGKDMRQNGKDMCQCLLLDGAAGTLAAVVRASARANLCRKTRVMQSSAFDQWCHRLTLSPATREFLARLRASPPVRRVQGRAQNVSGTYASRKMGMTIQFESHKVELWAIYAMEYDAQVLEYFDQPYTLTLTYQSPAGRTVKAAHTPDFLALRQDGVGFEEWKQEERLRALAVSHPGRYQRDGSGGWRCPPGEAAAAGLGLSYAVRSSATLHPTYIRNLIFLEDYCYVHRVAPDTAAQILEAVCTTPGISLAALLRASPHIGVAAVYALIARGGLYVDLVASPLKEHPQVRLYPDQMTAEAHVLLLAGPSSTPDGTRSVPVAVSHLVALLWSNITLQRYLSPIFECQPTRVCFSRPFPAVCDGRDRPRGCAAGSISPKTRPLPT